MKRNSVNWLGVAVGVWMLVGGRALANDALRAEVVTFQYAPTRWQTSICLPDDWQKTLVGKEGELLYDWGGGKYQGFKTRIGVRLEGNGEWVRQELVGAKLPIVQTVKRSGEVEIVEEAFAVAPAMEMAEKVKEPAAV
ncbi:MAG TPA: hypothetical protein VHP11_05520, partial [Tepidisphaeraceae bacterium]|nr:hypothetical protein [Tepidisphaeraceae bacterium]